MQPRARAAERRRADVFLAALIFHRVIGNPNSDRRRFAIEQAGNVQNFAVGIDPHTLHLAIAGDQVVGPGFCGLAGEGIFGGGEHGDFRGGVLTEPGGMNDIAGWGSLAMNGSAKSPRKLRVCAETGGKFLCR